MIKTLVVDDSPTSRAIVARLIDQDCSIVQASSGVEALGLLGSGEFDLLLLDLLMPGMDGKAVLAAMRERGIAVPVVVITADIQERTKASLTELGASVVANKPLTRAKLVAAIGEALASHRGLSS
jgi:CheY-like chemotaxis protein